jgi:hypothetical protein
MALPLTHSLQKPTLLYRPTGPLSSIRAKGLLMEKYRAHRQNLKNFTNVEGRSTSFAAILRNIPE